MFNFVLIDSSEFTGNGELAAIYGVRYIVLDDIFTYKNMRSFERLPQDADDRLVERSESLRNGFGIFGRRSRG